MTARALDDFLGSWQITRRITDYRAGQDGHFHGEARFVPDGIGLLYEETGLLKMAGAEMAASRRYLWRDAGAAIDVLFEDGRAFHSIATQADGAQAGHFCDPDQYDVAYDFSGWPNWQSVWRVTGPRKNYEMVSVYRR